MSAAQRLAVYALAGAKSAEEAAKAAGVCRQTISEWKSQPAFIAALNHERNRLARQIMARLRARMTAMTGAAFVGVSNAIKRGDAATARWWLDSIGIDEHAKRLFEKSVNPEFHPEDIEGILGEMAAQHVDEFLSSKNIGALERMRVKEILTAKEAEALRQENPKPEKED